MDSSFASELSWYHWVLGAAVGGLFAFKFLFPGLREKKRANLPPSPGVIPIVGSFPFMGVRLGEPAHKMFGRLAEKFGPITYLQMGANPTIVVSNSDIAKLVLKDQDHIFASRPYLSLGKYLGINFHTMALTPSGPYVKRLRKIYNQELFAPKRVSGTHAAREKGVFVMLGAVYQLHKEGEAINLSSVLKDLSLNSILSVLFGWTGGNEMVKSFGTVTLSDLKALIREVVELAGEFNVGDFITVARWLDLQGVIGRMKKYNKKMKAVAAAIIEEYERSGKKSPDASDANIFDMLLSLEGDDKLDSEGMAGVMYDLIIGGSDTTASSADWTLAELLRQPELVHRLQAELSDVIGDDRFVTEADIPSLPFLQAVVKESLRLHPPVPLAIPHCSTVDCTLAGYDIPAGTTTLVNLVAINRDPKHWPEPLRFSPERFLVQEKDVSLFGSEYHLLPFSSGRRQCPGMLMGFTMVQLIVANFVHGFDFQAAGGLTNDEIDVVNEAPGMVSKRTQDLRVTATPRLNSQVYEEFLLH